MKKNSLFLFVLLSTLCSALNAQNWTWTGETAAAGDWYLYHPNWGFIHADASSSYPTTTVSDATLFTITGAERTATKLAYKVGDTTYYLNNNNGSMSIKTTGSNLYVRIGNATDGYYITTYSAATLNTSTTGNNRYLNVWDGGAGWSRGNGGNKTQWRFISPAQMSNYERYVEVYRAAQSIGVDVSAYSTAKNSNATTVITNIENAIKALFPLATIDAPIDATGLIANRGYEFMTWNFNWTNNGFVKNQGNDAFNQAFVEMYQHTDWGGPTTGSIETIIKNLLNGVYKLKVKAVGTNDGTSNLYAKTLSEQRVTNVVAEGNYELMFRILESDNGQVTIGFNRDACYWWTAVDDWSLEYLGEIPTFTYEMGERLDGTYLSKPAYTSTPADGIDPTHPNDGLLVITWPNHYTDDPWAEFTFDSSAEAHVTADGVDTYVPLTQSFRSSNYTNGFALYIPDLDPDKLYTVTIPANVIGYSTAYGDAFPPGVSHVMNEEFTINAEQSPLPDGKYFIVNKTTGEHVSRGGHFGTQAILDYYGVPVVVQTAGLTVFKFLDNGAFLGRSYEPEDTRLYTDCENDRTQRYRIIPGEGDYEGQFMFYTPAPKHAGMNYMAHGVDTQETLTIQGQTVHGNGLPMMMESEVGDYFYFEPLTEEGYTEHLSGINDDEAKRVAERAGLAVENRAEYDELISRLAEDGVDTAWPVTSEEQVISETYHSAHKGAMAMGFGPDEPVKDLITEGEGRLTLTLNKGLYIVSLYAFQRATDLTTLQANQGFRGLVYYYAKVGDAMYKAQLPSITETEGTIPTEGTWVDNTETPNKGTLTALSSDEKYYTRIIFYVPADNTNVEFGVQNPQRLGNGIDENTESWVAFRNLKIEKFGAELGEASMTIKNMKYGTFLAPFKITMPAGVTAYTAKLQPGNPHVYLTIAAKPHEILDPKTPVLLWNDGADVSNRIYRGYDERDDTEQGTETLGCLVGFYKSGIAIPSDGTTYVLQTKTDGQAFYKVEPGSTFNGSANRCYAVAPDGISDVRMLVFSFDEEPGIEEDEETGIEEILSDDLSTANEQREVVAYDLSGRRVLHFNKGIYIINGKKVIK